MNKNDEAIVIAMVFLVLFGYFVYTYQYVTVDLPMVGTVRFQDYITYTIPVGLFIAFYIFWRVRREKQAGEEPTTEYGT